MRYPQIEREALAIIYAIEKFRLYLLGGSFVVHSDHQPLQRIFNNPRSNPNARIERWLLRVQQYDFWVKYQKGENNPADYLSRHPEEESDKTSFTEYCINNIISNCLPVSISMKCIVENTATDTVLYDVKRRLSNNNWDLNHIKDQKLKMKLQAFKNIKEELTVSESGVLIRGERIVIPEILQEDIINIAHEGHLGI